MDGCVRLGAVLPPLFIRRGSDADCAGSRWRAGQWGQSAAAAEGRALRKSEGGGELLQEAGKLRLRPGRSPPRTPHFL